MNKVNRKLNWVSSINKSKDLIDLENQLNNFYSNNKDYYNEIDFTANNWTDKLEPCYQEIVENAKNSNSICEIGCGSANILNFYPEIKEKYCGLDFSENQIIKNSLRFAESKFISFKKSNEFPVENEQFELVFSVFVIEHVINVSLFLDECKRILKPNGILIILCPDFLGRNRMTSQRAGLSDGNTKAKLKVGKYLDALITFYDNRIRIPISCTILKLKSNNKPKFWINLTPLMFEENFLPDYDAVYITYKKEIRTYLIKSFLEIKNSTEIIKDELNKKLIFLKMQKSK